MELTRTPTPIRGSRRSAARVERPDLFNLYGLMGEVERAMRRATSERICLLGGEGEV